MYAASEKEISDKAEALLDALDYDDFVTCQWKL